VKAWEKEFFYCHRSVNFHSKRSRQTALHSSELVNKVSFERSHQRATSVFFHTLQTKHDSGVTLAIIGLNFRLCDHAGYHQKKNCLYPIDKIMLIYYE